MKVKELLAILSQVDQELDIAVLENDDEYWGLVYKPISSAKERDEQIDGPKKPDRRVFVIE